MRKSEKQFGANAAENMTDPWTIQNSSETKKLTTNGIHETEQEENRREDQQAVPNLGQTEVKETSTSALEFEDNFIITAVAGTSPSDDSRAVITTATSSNQATEYQPLADSASYLQGLERKLQKLKKNSKLVDALAEKREDCMRTLLNQDSTHSSGIAPNADEAIEFDTPVSNSEFYRHLQPIQAVTVGETLHIVNYDQLEQQQQQLQENQAEKEDLPQGESERPESR